MSEIRVIFVLPDDAIDQSHASTVMKEAFNCCKELVDEICWMKQSDIKTENLTKLHYLVFEHLAGKDFSELTKTKCAIMGPLAISTCLSENKPIPSFQWPILNVTMYDCIVSCSQLYKTQKEDIKAKVQLMGGLYTKDFVENVTHLICDGTTSEKYTYACEKGIKLMLPSWIDYLWEESQLTNIYANDHNILDKYKCPPLHRLTICTTGILSSKDKTKLQDLISTNGGEMVGKLNLKETDILVCHGAEGSSSEKFKAAKARHLPCVTIDWIYDSIQKGYSLPHKLYEVKAITSTPTKDSENINPNFSCISAISISTTLQSQINETVGNLTPSVGDSKKRKASEELVDKIDMKRVKNAGNFLDGCSIFVAGFPSDQRDKLNKAINLSGATRYDNLSDRVTHVIIGDPFCAEVQQIKKGKINCAVISVQWLLDSIEQQKPVKEEGYEMANVDLKTAEPSKFGSPVSKKALNILKKSKTTVPSNEMISVAPSEDDDALTQKYLDQSTVTEKEGTLSILLRNVDIPEVPGTSEPEFTLRTRAVKRTDVAEQSKENQTLVDFQPQDSSTQMTAEGNTSIFCSYTFLVVGFDEENLVSLREFIQGSGGTIVGSSCKESVDYAVVPILNKPKIPFKMPVKEVVNELFVFESIEEDGMVNVQYYHRPLDIPRTNPFSDCVITVSVYTGHEREFLKSVVEGLGGVFQEQFSKKHIPSKSVLASTHLVTPEASGRKYEAAIKWNLPIVNKDWLLECANTGSKVDISNYVLGKPTPNITNTNESNDNSDRSKPNNSTSPSKMPVNIAAVTPTKNQELAGNLSTPSNTHCESDIPEGACTPANEKTVNGTQLNLETYSQVTPINKILQDAMPYKILATPSPKTYYPWDPKTPDTPIGAFIRENPSPHLRKEMQKYINSFPEFVPPRRLSTPLSELRRRLRNKVLYGEEQPSTSQHVDILQESSKPTTKQDDKINNEVCQPSDDEKVNGSEKLEVNQKLQELHEMVMASGSGSANKRSSRLFEAVSDGDGRSDEGVVRGKTEIHSQVCTIDWDYGHKESENHIPKIFMISGIEASQRESLCESIKSLGGVVSESPSYDASCTHLICPKTLRNEKTLACMAAGKWILHTSYIEKSARAGKFLNEELFEFGNTQSRQNVPYEEKDQCINFWRKEISKRGYGAFNNVRAIVIAEKRDPLVKVIEAGGGVIVNVTPPFDDAVHATHCLLEAKVIKDMSLYTPLALQGIKCVNTIYINEFLRKCGKEDSSYVLPNFNSFYHSRDSK